MFHELLSSEKYDFRYECGVGVKYSDKYKIAAAFSKYFAVVCCYPQLQQLKEKLSILGVLELLEEKQLVHDLFAYSAISLTSNQLYDLFTPHLSPEGSNQRADEETTLYHRANYLQLING